jgi:GTPase SAR1 family protein
MSDQIFKATLSKSQDRDGWCVIFKHPLRIGKNGKAGLRVRRGLGTKVEAEAQGLVNQLNKILGDQTLWNPTEINRAKKEFHPKIISAFYDKITPEKHDPWATRNKILPLPGKEEGYVKALLVGTTGAGKTTVVRQLIGTDPEKERFPSTSSAKTTTSNIELICITENTYKAVVSFFDKSYVRQHIEECVLSAGMAHLETKDKQEVENKFLVHNEQRFRLSYLLGSSKSLAESSVEDEITDEITDEEISEPDATNESEISSQEKNDLRNKLSGYLSKIMSISEQSYQELANEFDIDVETAEKDDLTTLQELLEEKLYAQNNFQNLVDTILDDVESKFKPLDNASLVKDKSNWPLYWTFESTDRSDFIKKINRFSSNYAPNFGCLLTPLVEGIRVAGPFKPSWSLDDETKLVIMDGEGLGHTPDSASSISTSITERFQLADAIILVDNAAQPMQAAPTAVLQSLVSSGHHRKLIVCFTHFDEVKGINIPNVAMRKDHVLDSFDNSVVSVGKTLGQRAERVLKACKTDRIFFLSKTQQLFKPNRRSLIYNEFVNMLSAIQKTIDPPVPTDAIPIYDDSNLVLNIQKASREFHIPWEARLKLRLDSRVKPEHWTRIKALSRRLGELNVVEYSDLRPVADMISRFQIHLYLFVENPIAWEPASSPDEMKQVAIDNITQELDAQLHKFFSKRLFKDKIKNWHQAYNHRGTGSTKVRASEIKNIYHDAAPVPGEVPNSESSEFVKKIREILQEAIATGNGKLRS